MRAPIRAVTLDLDGLDADAVEAALFSAGAYSVVLTDRRDDAILEPKPGEVRLWPATRLQALFPVDAVTEDTLVALTASIGCSRTALQVEEIADRVWEREWLKDSKALRFGTNLWICPSHATVDAQEAIVVALEPGLAFGTGTHPTTRLCLEFLDQSYTDGRLVSGSQAETTRVVDYGCGSGVLAIAALKLWPQAHALAYDIDPQALTATHDNALANGVFERIETFAEAATLASRLPVRGKADLVLANILSGPLCELSPILCQLLAPGGELVLAGLLDEQADEVISAYASMLALQRWRSLDGWTCLVGRKAQ